MARTNMYKGFCGECKKVVQAGDGFLDGPPWVTFCKTCWAKFAPSNKPVVKVTMANAKEFLVAPTQYLGGEYFTNYRIATDAAGGVYDADTKQKRVPVKGAQKLITALEAAGFLVSVSRDVVATLQAYVAAKKAMIEAASQHLAKVESNLSNRTLFPFQRKGIEWLAPRSAALLADEMGLGKTAEALCALPFGAPVVIVCPVVAKGVWKAEIKVWRPDYAKVTVLKGHGSFRWPEPGEIVLTNYEVLPVDVAEKAPEGTVLVADEAHMVKSKKAKRTKAFASVGNAVHSAHGRIWLLTATPLLNTPPELWTVLEGAGLATEAFGSFKDFKKLFGYAKSWGKPSAGLCAGLATVMLRRHRLDVLPDLPTKIRNNVDVSIDSATAKLCDDVLEELAAMGVNLDAAVGEAAATQLTGAVFQKISKARAALATAKIPSMIETIEQYEDAQEPLVVFSAHRAPIDVLASRHGWAVITGDTPPEERTEIEKRFQAGELIGIGATIRAGGVAITLTHAHHALFVDLAWTPALNSQAEDRICRIGQDQGVLVKRLIAQHRLDRRVAELLTNKQILIEETVEAAAVGKSEAIEVTLEATVQSEEAAIKLLQSASEKAKIAEVKAKLNGKKTYTPTYTKVRRAPESDAEKWASSGLLVLADLDPDFASAKNDVGFNGTDGVFGHSLAQQVAQHGGLTDAQWAAAINMLRKYHKQIGPCPC